MKWIGKHPVFSDLLIGGVLLTPPDNQYSYELTLPNDDGTAGQVLTTDGNGVLTWTTNASGSGTVTSITPAADSGSGTAITSSGTFTFTGGTNVTTAVSGRTVTINATDTNTTYSAGDGLDLSGTTFSADIKADSGIVIDSTELSMDLGASSITGTLAVGDGGTGATSLTDNAILSGTGSSAITAEDTSISSGIISRSGTIELAGTTVTLDSAANIQLEVGAATNYVNTTGLYRGGNIGDIQYVSSVYYIPITATDFQGMSDARGACAWGMEGLSGGEWASHSGQSGFIEKVIPLGFTATSCVIYGDTGTNTFQPFESALNASTVTSRGSATAVGSVCTFSSNVVGDGTKTISIKLIVGESRDFFFGGKLILIKT
jgi:hypothetical protein